MSVSIFYFIKFIKMSFLGTVIISYFPCRDILKTLQIFIERFFKNPVKCGQTWGQFQAEDRRFATKGDLLYKTNLGCKLFTLFFSSPSTGFWFFCTSKLKTIGFIYFSSLYVLNHLPRSPPLITLYGWRIKYYVPFSLSILVFVIILGPKLFHGP